MLYNNGKTRIKQNIKQLPIIQRVVVINIDFVSLLFFTDAILLEVVLNVSVSLLFI